jgi:hypothetical protein
MLDALGYKRNEVIGREYLPMFVPPEEHHLVFAVMDGMKRTASRRLMRARSCGEGREPGVALGAEVRAPIHQAVGR